MLRILFFARLSEELDCREERLALPAEVSTTGELRQLLGQRGPQWHNALHSAGVLVAVEQQVADWDRPLNGDEEVAFFPPVTGG